MSVHWCNASRRKLPDRAEYPAPSPGHLIQDLQKRGGIGIRIGEERLKRPAVGIDSVERIQPQGPLRHIEAGGREFASQSADRIAPGREGRAVAASSPQEMRYFGGLSIEETAESLGVSAVTVTRDWQIARAWLTRELGPGANASA